MRALVITRPVIGMPLDMVVQLPPARLVVICKHSYHQSRPEHNRLVAVKWLSRRQTAAMID